MAPKASQRYYNRLKEDPEKYAAYLEKKRITLRNRRAAAKLNKTKAKSKCNKSSSNSKSLSSITKLTKAPQFKESAIEESGKQEDVDNEKITKLSKAPQLKESAIEESDVLENDNVVNLRKKIKELESKVHILTCEKQVLKSNFNELKNDVVEKLCKQLRHADSALKREREKRKSLESIEKNLKIEIDNLVHQKNKTLSEYEEKSAECLKLTEQLHFTRVEKETIGNEVQVLRIANKELQENKIDAKLQDMKEKCMRLKEFGRKVNLELQSMNQTTSEERKMLSNFARTLLDSDFFPSTLKLRHCEISLEFTANDLLAWMWRKKYWHQIITFSSSCEQMKEAGAANVLRKVLNSSKHKVLPFVELCKELKIPQDGLNRLHKADSTSKLIDELKFIFHTNNRQNLKLSIETFQWVVVEINKIYELLRRSG